MNRKTFLYRVGVVGVVGLMNPVRLFAHTAEGRFVPKELMGIHRPDLYGEGFNLRKEAATAFQNMVEAARKEGIKLYSASSYRSFDHQNRIWERKYNLYKKQGLSEQQIFDKIVEYSTIPGTSRHHWGTDLDVIDLSKSTPSDPLRASHFEEGVYRDLHQWLLKHANDFGFYEVYTNVKERKGFAYEPWHYSYKPLSIPILKAMNKLNLRDVLANLSLKGSEHFSQSFIDRYIRDNLNDINPVLQDESYEVD